MNRSPPVRSVCRVLCVGSSAPSHRQQQHAPTLHRVHNKRIHTELAYALTLRCGRRLWCGKLQLLLHRTAALVLEDEAAEGVQVAGVLGEEGFGAAQPCSCPAWGRLAQRMAHEGGRGGLVAPPVAKVPMALVAVEVPAELEHGLASLRAGHARVTHGTRPHGDARVLDADKCLSRGLRDWGGLISP